MTPPPYGSLLNERDYSHFRGISPEILQQAHVRRTDSLEGGSIVGRNGRGDYSGFLFPNYWPGTDHPRECRLRRDNPEMESDETGKLKPKNKYLSPPGRKNLFYFPPGINPDWLADPTVPIAITEGEKKTLALHGLALHGLSDTAEHPRWVSIGLAGVWNWRGTIGKTTNAAGNRVDVKGIIPDFDLVTWKGREVKIIFDANVYTNQDVEWARNGLEAALRKKGAIVSLVDIPESAGVNGVDDLVAEWGEQKVLDLISESKPSKSAKSPSVATEGWESELLTNKDGAPKGCLANAITALSTAPEWDGVLGFNDFTLDYVTLKPPPWSDANGITEWKDVDDIRLSDWLHKKTGIQVSSRIAYEAVQVVAHQHAFHPVREYLTALEWDGTPRLDTWMPMYLGAPDSDYSRAVGSKFLISAVARIFKPGIKVDCVPILRGLQGNGKSTFVKILFGDWSIDRISDIGSKDSMQEIGGVWGVEFAEFSGMSKADANKLKAFCTSAVDRYRVPYGKRPAKVPRQCVFIVTVNQDSILKDETGARRFWPLRCSQIELAQLVKDRDQLWAEAVHRYRAGDTWWLDTDELNRQAVIEQDDCYQGDPWDEIIQPWIQGRESVSISEILEKCIGKNRENWAQADQNRVARTLCFFHYEKFRDREGGVRSWRYRLSDPSR